MRGQFLVASIIVFPETHINAEFANLGRHCFVHSCCNYEALLSRELFIMREILFEYGISGSTVGLFNENYGLVARINQNQGGH